MKTIEDILVTQAQTIGDQRTMISDLINSLKDMMGECGGEPDYDSKQSVKSWETAKTVLEKATRMIEREHD